MNRRTAILVSTILTAFILAGWAASQPPTAPEIDAELVGLRAGSSDDGFARALESRTFQFPADHGPHPEYRTEWWYYTGNLETDAGRAIDGAQYRHFDGAQYR
ncbi:MAG: carotenoid 1,2-hydratase, partial [Anaerolineae bacterium]